MTPNQPFKKSEDIAAYLTEVLEGIKVSEGYNTDIGTTVFRGRIKHDEDRIPYCTVIEGEDRVGSSGLQKDVEVSQDFVLGAYLACDPDNPNDAAHQAIRDIKKAVFTSDLARRAVAGARGGNGRVKSLEYGGKDIGPRADGRPIVFAVVYVTVTFAEDLLDA